jgi:hypothetical protein
VEQIVVREGARITRFCEVAEGVEVDEVLKLEHAGDGAKAVTAKEQDRGKRPCAYGVEDGVDPDLAGAELPPR